jgi:CheY-like chemotaxis protein
MNDSKSNKSGPAPGNKALIYVVDDEPMLLELAAVILEPLGYLVKTFRHPRTAVEAFTSAEPRPALIITDYAMHAMTGMDLIEACRQAQPRQKILLVSGTVGEDIYHDSPTKPDRFLAKPYHAKQLTSIVESLLAT